ncbi:DUF5681 domain-containing protein [Phreatobacter sp.]|uniref:DUF5681 domain-containing protein n=1 Tax=Phreatobacter sp. TaxID=1966341 RepID=UPI003F714C69
MTGNRGQFAKGQSGNPRGRPKRSTAPATSPFDVIVEKTLTVTRNGVERQITMEEALQHRTYQDALAGKRMARREVLRWIEKREAWRAKTMPTVQPSGVTVLTENDPANADDALLLLGIASHDRSREGYGNGRAQLLLEPWAVTLALRRRKTARGLTEKEIDDIRRTTRDAATLTLPKATAE